MSKRTLLAAAKTEDRLETLIVLRDILARRLDNCASNRDIAAMSRRLMQVLTEIEEIREERAAQSRKQIDLATFRTRFKLDRKIQ